MGKIPVRRDDAAKKPRPESNEVMDIESADDVVSELEKSHDDIDTDTEAPDKHLSAIQKQSRFKRFGSWIWRKKWLVFPLILLAILGGILAFPVTRYAATSWFWKESISVKVIDDGNNRPVSEAEVTVAGQSSKTNNQGIATFAGVPVGQRQVVISKKNYQQKTNDIEVPLFAKGKEYEAEFHATGRVSEVVVTNRLTGAAVKAALITITQDDKAQTDESGKAQVVIPTDKKELKATVKAEGYLDAELTLTQTDKKELALVPAGTVYFLSKQRGVVDVVKSNLDGSGRTVVVEGTGNEDDRETNLLASRDWRYLLLRAKRTAGKLPGLYLFDTAKGSLELVDQSNASFDLIGWSGHNFFYDVYRNDKTYTDNGYESVRMINAESRKMSVVDERQSVDIGAGAHYYQSFGSFYIVDDGVYFTKTWYRTYNFAPEPTDKQAEIVRVAPDGKSKKTIKAFPSQTISYITAKLYEPQEIYYEITKTDDQNKKLYAELENGVYREGVDGDKFNASYPTFIMSPGGSKAFWSESRDGKNTLLIGGKNAENKQEILTKSEFKAYGWLTEEYVLMQKADSELYISSPDQIKAGKEPLKISDYHKPQTNFAGYGYGYGGQ